VTKSHSQSLPISSYGVWDRGGQINDFSDPNVDFVMGIEAAAKWADIELVKGTFDFSSLQTAIDKAATSNKLIRLSVEAGPDTPLWMYDSDTNPNNNLYPQVQKVYTNDGNAKPFWPFYPEYLSQTYQNYLWVFLQKFSDFLRSQPAEKFAKIAFVQVKTGCTGDEIPYKGLNPSVVIKDQQWYDFRLTVFEKYKEYFNDVPNKKIVLTFNDIDPSDPNEIYAWHWTTTNIDPAIGFGIKGGAFNRGHHLSGEQSYKNSLYNYLFNPTGLKLFSGSEMDGTTQNAYFQICEDMSYYWAALGGINVGLSTNNLNAVAMNYASNNASGRETFRMFTRYAQQVYPATSTTAFSIFHDGLNSADTNRFPEKDFGNTKATMNNSARYTAICKAYKSRGARMDDLYAAMQGQVYQRANQTRLNDAGWNIAEGNIERFITQIDPNNTSIGLFRVRGEITKTSSKYDRFARSFECQTNKNKMFFQVHSEFPANNKVLKFTIIWLDRNVGGTWAFQYRNATGLQSRSFTGTGGDTWKTETFTLSDAIINQGGERGSDFMLVNTDGDNQTGKQFDDIFNGIEMNIIGAKQPQTINFNAIPDKKIGDPDFSLDATASSGLTISYLSSDEQVAKYVNGKIQIVGIGSTTITAYQAGNNAYESAAVSQELRVAVVNQTTITTAGTSTWTSPAGVRKITVECWGAGGGGGGAYAQCVGGGGAGGSYVTNTLAITPLTSYSLTVGAGGTQATGVGTNGISGGNTRFESITPLIANGGAGGFGSGVPSPLVARAGSGGTNLTGGSGGTITLGSSGAAGAIGTSPYGGAGGSSGNSHNTGAAPKTTVGGGISGTIPGGGGSGAYGPASPATNGNNRGGSGAAGQVKISYILSVPDAPIIGTTTATGLSGEVSVSFTAPTFDGNNAITSYTATASPGGRTATMNQSGSGSITITGLTNGTAYTFTVKAINSIGQSASSASSNAATPVRTSQNIVFNAIPTKTFGDTDFSAGAIASSGLTVYYESSNSAVARIENGLIQIIGVGTANITAYQEGDGTYSTATPVVRQLTVVNRLVFSNGMGGGSWSAATTWALGLVPLLIDNVSIIGSDAITISSAANCNSLAIAATSSLKVNSNSTLTVANAISNNGTLTLENNSNLIQINEGLNSGSGTSIVKRDSNALKRLDYTMWSSPVTGAQTLFQFSPLTSATSPVRFYTYNPITNLYTAATVGNPFAPATGYLIRMPNEKPGSLGLTTDYYKGLEAIIYNGVFTGTLNNGTITLNSLISDKYYAVGNPYPSTISANAFLSGNATAGTLYFWRKTNGAAGSAYATYTLAGGTGTSAGTGGLGNPNGTIQVGQGFIAKTGTLATSLSFTNAMRTPGSSTQFFKTKKVVDNSRVWLNLTNTKGAFSQAMIAYLDGATLGVDQAIDGKYINDSKIALTSIVSGEEYVIQGRPAFDAADVVALGFKTDVAGDYTIALDSFDGLFTEGQDVYLLDSFTGKEVDLKAGSYSFTAAVGAYNARFSLKYQKKLNVDAPAFNENTVTVFKNNGVITVNSSSKAIKTVQVYDVRGRLIAQQRNANATKASFNNLRTATQVLVVKVTVEGNKVVFIKIVN
jgi:hypothetical protein